MLSIADAFPLTFHTISNKWPIPSSDVHTHACAGCGAFPEDKPLAPMRMDAREDACGEVSEYCARTYVCKACGDAATLDACATVQTYWEFMQRVRFNVSNSANDATMYTLRVPIRIHLRHAKCSRGLKYNDYDGWHTYTGTCAELLGVLSRIDTHIDEWCCDGIDINRYAINPMFMHHIEEDITSAYSRADL